jgi:hypothetical protein
MSVAAGGDDAWYAVVDTARDPALYELVCQSQSRQCLIGGKLPEPLAAAAPYLVRLQPDEPLTKAWQGPGAGQSWGIMLRSPLSIDPLRVHLKKFLQAKLPDGRVVLFRFYDPRVFRTYIRAALAEERAPWFKGVTVYAVEAETNGQFHNFNLQGGVLHDGVAALG